MSHLLLGRKGNMAFYAYTIVYLYGDLAIYAVAALKSMCEILCPRPAPDVAQWQYTDRLSSSDLYRLLVVIFRLLLGPFAIGQVHSTRMLQLVTTVICHASFGLKIILAAVIARGMGRGMAEMLVFETPAPMKVEYLSSLSITPRQAKRTKQF